MYNPCVDALKASARKGTVPHSVGNPLAEGKVAEETLTIDKRKVADAKNGDEETLQLI